MKKQNRLKLIKISSSSCKQNLCRTSTTLQPSAAVGKSGQLLELRSDVCHNVDVQIFRLWYDASTISILQLLTGSYSYHHQNFWSRLFLHSMYSSMIRVAQTVEADEKFHEFLGENWTEPSSLVCTSLWCKVWWHKVQNGEFKLLRLGIAAKVCVGFNVCCHIQVAWCKQIKLKTKSF